MKSDTLAKLLNKIIKFGKKYKLLDENKISDTHHTFDELYEYRLVYNALVFNEWSKSGEIEVYKSIRHSDGELCFGGGWFIVVAILPTGQISNHYKLKDWDLFKIPECDKSIYDYDGHTPSDCLIRMRKYLK